MPDAVIVATARTPIGRANKGSLVDARPDDLSSFIISEQDCWRPGVYATADLAEKAFKHNDDVFIVRAAEGAVP